MPKGTGDINKAPQGGSFMFKPKPVKKPKKGPVRLLLREKPCGCTFRYAPDGTFRTRCEFHKALRASLCAERKRVNALMPLSLFPKVKKPKLVKKQKPDTPEFLAAFRAEIARRTELAAQARAAIKKPTRKLTKREREHLHTFAFTAEQVRAEISKP